MSHERRHNQRKRILLEAKWESMSRRHEARIDDISLGGCFVNTYGNAEIGEAVSLEMELPSGEWLPLRGIVASSQPGVGFGMAFRSLTDDQIAALRELLLTVREREP